MVALARKTLRHEWRRFLPAIVAVGFAGLLQLLQAALVLGIFSGASLYVTASDADVWVGYPGTQSVSLGRSINEDIDARLLMDPAIATVQPFDWVDGDWRGPRGGGGVTVFVCGTDPQANGMLFSHLLTPAQRGQLKQPGGVIVDRADLHSLGVLVGEIGQINGHKVHVVAAVDGLRALGGVNVVASLETARELNNDPADGGRTTFLLARLHHVDDADAVVQRLNQPSTFAPHQAWTAADFAHRSQMHWILDTGAGMAILFLAGIVFMVGAVITSQTLMAAVAASISEYATLNALGVGLRALRRVVMEQAFWIGVVGLAGSLAAAALLFLVARRYAVPIALDWRVIAACLIVNMALALASGLMAVRSLRRVDPAVLLR